MIILNSPFWNLEIVLSPKGTAITEPKVVQLFFLMFYWFQEWYLNCRFSALKTKMSKCFIPRSDCDSRTEGGLIVLTYVLLFPGFWNTLTIIFGFFFSCFWASSRIFLLKNMLTFRRVDTHFPSMILWAIFPMSKRFLI